MSDGQLETNFRRMMTWPGSGVADDPAAVCALGGADRTRDADRIGFRRIHAGQFHHFPRV